MGILGTLKKVKEDGFDPTKDAINSSSRLDSGNYPVRLIEAERTVDKYDRENIAIKMEVVSGEFKDRTETIFLNFDDKLPEFVLETNGKILMKLAEYAGIKFKNAELTDEESTADALKRGIGNQFMLKIKLSPNKKNPEYPFRNYDFDKLVDDNEVFDIEDDDLPF